MFRIEIREKKKKIKNVQDRDKREEKKILKMFRIEIREKKIFF